MLDEGTYTTVSEIDDAENIPKSYVSRLLRLALLAPDIIEAVLAGSTDQGIMLETLEWPLPASSGKGSGRSRLLCGPAEQRLHPGSVRCGRIDVLHIVRIGHFDFGDCLGVPLDQVAAAEVEPAIE